MWVFNSCMNNTSLTFPVMDETILSRSSAAAVRTLKSWAAAKIRKASFLLNFFLIFENIKKCELVLKTDTCIKGGFLACKWTEKWTRVIWVTLSYVFTFLFAWSKFRVIKKFKDKKKQILVHSEGLPLKVYFSRKV